MHNTTQIWSSESHGFRLEWNWHTDRARLVEVATGRRIWSGSLLPTLKTAGSPGDQGFSKALVKKAMISGNRAEFDLEFPGLATGHLLAERSDGGVAIRSLNIEWPADPVPLQGLYFGAAPLSDAESLACPDPEATFWPDWRADGFCIPGSKGNPGQSFWRSWDLGQAVVPLGSFGPAMGSPYTAAFPRPLLSAAMGDDSGWLAFGPGEVPSAALSLDIKSSSAWLRYWMREDLWGAPAGRRRTWNEPLRLTWKPVAWDSFERLFATFPAAPPAPASVQTSQWGTWGNFKKGIFDLDADIKRALRFGVADLQIDDLWETWNSSAIVDRERFPDFDNQLKRAREAGLRIDLWQSIGWVDRPEEAGLTAEDLLCGPDGRPRLTHWGADPRSEQILHFALDPSSENARNFLIERTRRTMREFSPSVLKLDFGYGMPGPDTAAPRNPELRGERLCLELLRIITETAREENPEIGLEYWGIHPLMRPVYNLLSLDDLGDMGTSEVEGHHQRSIWTALCGDQKVGIMASSGYFWGAFEEILLNAAILGAPGACLPDVDDFGERATPRISTRFRALSRWHRRTIGWKPLWLNSHQGDLTREPTLRCWGRLEGESGALTALALRGDSADVDLAPWGISDWAGRWAIISQDGAAIDLSRKVACIPLDPGVIQWASSARVHRVIYSGGTESNSDPAPSNRLACESEAELDKLMGFVIERE